MMTRLRPSTDVLVAHLEGEAVLLDLTTKRYFRLNATSAAIWRALEAGKGRDEVVRTLVGDFEVDEPVVAKAVDDMLAELATQGLLREMEDDANG